MPFAQILGHQQIIDGLRAARAHDRVPHAYMFCGPEGIGKSLVATAFAQLLCCAEANESDDACGQCRTCRLIAEKRHPDLITLEPQGAFIKISQVREVTKMLRFPPVEAPYRIVMIEPAETLHPAAANALLKTLEEPSPRNIFILVTAQPHAILATIRSRTQQIRFSLLQRSVVSQWLIDNKELAPGVAAEVAAISGGSIGAAADLADPELEILRKHWLAQLRELAAMSTGQVIDAAEKLAAEKTNIPTILDVMRLAIRDLALKSVGAPGNALTFREFAAEFAPMTQEPLFDAVDDIDEAERALTHNVNPRMVAENLLLRLRDVFAPNA
jgi:DNA polymerase-3 subunit delta'